MSNTVSVEDAWARALHKADMTNSGFPPDINGSAADVALIDAIANEGLSELHSLLVETHEDYLTKESSEISIVAGTESYTLPTDFVKCVAAFLHLDGRRYQLESYQFADLDGLRTAPVTAGTVKLFYIPEPAYWQSGGPTSLNSIIPALPKGWERLIICHMAMSQLEREESFERYQQVAMEKEREIQRIRDHAETRDYDGNVVADFYGRYSYTGLRNDRIQRDYRYKILSNKIYFTQVDPYGL